MDDTQHGNYKVKQHYILIVCALFHRASVIIIDGMATSALIPERAIIFERLLVGGTSSVSSIPVTESFRGCMDSLILNGR